MVLLAHGEDGSSGGLFPPWEAHPATVHFPIAFLVGVVAVGLLSCAMMSSSTRLWAASSGCTKTSGRRTHSACWQT